MPRTQLTMKNKFNPLYDAIDNCDENQPVKTAEISSKEAKRLEKVNREMQAKTSKDTTDTIDTKMTKIGATITNDILEGMERGFELLAKTMQQIQTNQTPAIQNNHPKAQPCTPSKKSQNEPTQESQLGPTIFSQDIFNTVSPQPLKEQHPEEKLSDYDRLIQRMSTLPPGQAHLPRNWADDPDLPVDPEEPPQPADQTHHQATNPTQVSPDIHSTDDSPRMEDEISNSDLKRLIKALDTKYNDKISILTKQNLNQENRILQLEKDLKNKDTINTED